MSFENVNNLSVDEALTRIEGIRGQIMQLGANDYEQSAINSIIEQLKSGNISSEEAVRKAQHIMNSKNDYH